MTFPKHIHLSIDHNEHHAYYETIEEFVAHSNLLELFENREDYARSILNDEIWTIQWYPNTPVGFNLVAASSLEKALEMCNRIGEPLQNQHN